jgi:hypothetical protein
VSKRPTRCKVCCHRDRARIELLRAGGASCASLAVKFKVSEDSIQRHWAGHVSAESKATFLAGPGALETWAQKAGAESDSILDYLRLCRTSLTAQLSSCSDAGDASGVARVSIALTQVLAAIGKVTGELSTLASLHVHQNNTVNVAASSEYVNLRTAVLQALRKHPQARADVLSAVHRLNPQAVPAPTAAAGNGLLIDVTPAPGVVHG